MIKLMDLLLEVKLSPEEQEQYKQALAILKDDTLEEGIMDKLKKLGLSATVITALLASPQLSKAQKIPLDQLASKPVAAAKASLGRFGQEKTQSSSQVLGVDVLKQWDELRNWLGNTTVGQIDGSSDTSKLMGNPKLDKSDFNKKVVNAYKKSHPQSNITDTATVQKIQNAIINHRNGTIEADKSGGINLAKGQFRGTDYSNYLKHVSKIEQKAQKEGEVDGIIGQYTSQVQIPHDLRSNPTAVYAPTPVKEHKITK